MWGFLGNKKRHIISFLDYWRFKMWYHSELNQGHTDFQSVALPTELWYLTFDNTKI